MNTFTIKDIVIEKNRIDYEYTIEGEWKKYFSFENKFWVEYSQDIDRMPKALAAVPLVSNIIVLASIFDAKIYVPCLDEDFYLSINQFMNGFSNMYPMIRFNYENAIVCNHIIDTKKDNIKNDDDNALLYFSGGVDAYTSLIRHEHENLILLTVCGADTYYNNKFGFQNIIQKNETIANLHNLSIVSCTSTLRNFINEKEIYDYLKPLINDNFWHGFQHGLGMFGLSAGFVYLYDLKKTYFASSFCDKDENYTCGSDPSIDNYVHIGSSKVCHDGFELSRQDKIAGLCRYSRENNKKIKLRVCYSSGAGDNCCKCEKCVRSMLGILVNGYSPKDFGFDQFDFTKIFKDLITALKIFSESPDIAYAIYNEIFSKLKEMYSYEDFPDEIKVFYNSSFKDVMSMLNIIRMQEIESNSDADDSIEYHYNNPLFKDYIIEDQNRYQQFCNYTYKNSKLCPTQKKDYWIGNGGFVLNPNEYIDVNNGIVTIHARRDIVVLEGWAADFVNGTPLAHLFVKINKKYYNLNYGLENKNLAKHFKNELYSTIAFRAEIPFHVIKKAKNHQISFCLISYQGEKLIRYPELKYAISIG